MNESNSNEKSKKNRSIKDGLKSNKIYFETIAAVLLGIMAIILSASQVFISCQQNKLIEKQMKMADVELKTQLFNDRINYVKDWNEVKTLLRVAEFLYDNNYWNESKVKDYFKNMNRKDKANWVDEFLGAIKPVGSNRVIIEVKSLHENYLAIETRLLDLQRYYAYSEPNKEIDEVMTSSFYIIWRHFFRINTIVNRPRAQKDLEDSSYSTNVRFWQYGTDSLMQEIEELKLKSWNK